MNEPTLTKAEVRRQLKTALADMSAGDRQRKSHAACNLVMETLEWRHARVVMIYLSIQTELDTAPLALRAWQEGKTVAVPKVSWNQRRMLPVEISSLTSGMTTSGPGVREPEDGQPVPLDLIDLVIVPGLGFTADGNRIGRGMGFYDRFLSQKQFRGLSCGLAFEEQVVSRLPLGDNDMPLNMLITDHAVRRFGRR